MAMLSVGEAKEYKKVKYVTYKDDTTNDLLALSSQPGVTFCLEAKTPEELEEKVQHQIDAYWKTRWQQDTVRWTP